MKSIEIFQLKEAHSNTGSCSSTFFCIHFTDTARRAAGRERERERPSDLWKPCPGPAAAAAFEVMMMHSTQNADSDSAPYVDCVYVASVTIIHVLQYFGNRGITDIMIDSLIKSQNIRIRKITMYEMKYYRNSLIDFNQSSHGYPQSNRTLTFVVTSAGHGSCYSVIRVPFFISLSYKIKLLNNHAN